MQTISVIIITKNEEANIKDCIETVLWADEIVIIDAISTDQTQKICEQYAPKVKIHIADWPGFGIQKNRALQFATSNWILSLDADERITPTLKQEIQETIKKNSTSAAYKIPRLNYFLGKPMKYGFGFNSDAPVRLAQKNLCEFTPDIVHEQLITTGNIDQLKNPLLHFPFENLEKLTSKINSYSTLGATTLHQKNKNTNFLQALIHATWVFVKVYFLRLGFLSGWRGFLLAFSNFEGTFYRYLKLFEKNNFESVTNSDKKST